MPVNLKITRYPWFRVRRSKSLIEIQGAPNILGGRDLVCVVDGDAVDADAVAIEHTPLLIVHGSAVVDAHDASAPAAVMQAAVDDLRATISSATP